MGTLAGILSESGTWAGGAAAQVLDTGIQVHVDIYQGDALGKGRAEQDVTADVLLENTERLSTSDLLTLKQDCHNTCNGDRAPPRAGQEAPPP